SMAGDGGGIGRIVAESEPRACVAGTFLWEGTAYEASLLRMRARVTSSAAPALTMVAQEEHATMEDRQPSSRLEELLEYQGWVKTLALSLARDEMTADDLAQQAWLAYLTKPPDSQYAATSWFRAVVWRLWSRRNREEARRRAREQVAAVAERVPSPDKLLEQADLHQKIAVAVAHLPEIYRTVVLLRYFEDASSAEIAEELGIPVSTVRTRLARAKDQLRQALDADYSDRTRWQAIALPFVTPAAGAAALRSANGSHETVVSASKSSLLATAALMAVGLGVAVLATTAYRVHLEAPPQMATSNQGSGQTLQPNARSKTFLASVARNAKLRAQVAQKREQLALLRQQVAQLGGQATAEETDNRASVFQLPSLSVPGTNWLELGTALRDMNYWREQIYLSQVSGPQRADVDMVAVRAFRSAKLVVDHYALIAWEGVFESHVAANANAGLTHPFCLSNVVAALLAGAGLSLDNEQRRRIQVAVDKAAGDLAVTSHPANDSAFVLELILGEVRVKDRFVGDLEQVLTRPQLAAVFPLEHRDIVNFDALTPALSLVSVARAVQVHSTEEAVETAMAHIAEQRPWTMDLLADHRHLFARWATQILDREADSRAAPVQEQRGVILEHALVAGEAYLRLLRQLAVQLDERRPLEGASLKDVAQFLVPTLLDSSED
ncbi:MAG: sigma-70 family RNA polymerase sigma factor, partial [Planctomycetota bacterium]